MNRYLIIVIGKNFVHPMFVSADWQRFALLLSKESVVNPYIYLIYQYNDNRDIYFPYMILEKGNYRGFDGHFVKGVIYDS